MKRPWFLRYCLVAGVVNAVACGYVLLAVSGRFDGNHTRHEPLLAGLLLVPTLGSLAAPFLLRHKAATLACVLWVIGFAGLLVVDQFNLLVNYDRWLARGMSSPWETERGLRSGNRDQ